MDKVYINVQETDFDISAELASMRNTAVNTGALVSFTGLVREFHQSGESSEHIQELFLEHYPGMTEKCLRQIATEAMTRWELLGCRVIHRIGQLTPGDQIVLVITASEHRHAAFESAEFIMDYLKTRAPFWKRQKADSGSGWVEHRISDETAAKRWKN